MANRVCKTYLIQSVKGGPVKIGKSLDPEKRLASMQTGSPVELQLLAVIPRDVERELHDRFSHAHSHGEWFAPTEDLVAFVDELAGKAETTDIAMGGIDMDGEWLGDALLRRFGGRVIRFASSRLGGVEDRATILSSWFYDLMAKDENLSLEPLDPDADPSKMQERYLTVCDNLAEGLNIFAIRIPQAADDNCVILFARETAHATYMDHLLRKVGDVEYEFDPTGWCIQLVLLDHAGGLKEVDLDAARVEVSGDNAEVGAQLRSAANRLPRGTAPPMLQGAFPARSSSGSVA